MSEESKSELEQQGPVATIYDEVPWDKGNRPVSKLKGLMKKAAEMGAKRKKVITGQAGFYMNRSVMPADFRVPVHSHSHDEFLSLWRAAVSLTTGSSWAKETVSCFMRNIAMVLPVVRKGWIS